MAKKSIVSDFKLKIKIICVCILVPPTVIELYNLLFMDNSLVFPALEVGTVLWAIICGVYLLFMMTSKSLQKVSIKEGIDYSTIRRKVMLLICIFFVVSIVFSVLSVMEFKQRSSWQEGIQEAKEIMSELEQ